MSTLLAVRPPCAVMLAKPGAHTVPEGSFLYEPKWDGFRVLVFRTEDGVVLQSRSEQDISYAFPEVVEAAMDLAPGTVIDGELAILHGGRVDFALLSTRLRPRSEADGNIALLAQRHPATVIAFDLLGLPARDVRGQTAIDRRSLLRHVGLPQPWHLTPSTTDHAVAVAWFDDVIRAGLDGIIAKPMDGVYEPGRRALIKVKHTYTVDAVVAGWRPHKQLGRDGAPQVGSLLLGLFDTQGQLQHVGSAAGLSAASRAELTELLAGDLGDDHPWLDAPEGVRVPDTPNRWKHAADKQLMLVDPVRVAEVRFDGMEGERFRHVASLVRWRPDRDATSCGFEQLPDLAPLDVTTILDLASQQPDH